MIRDRFSKNQLLLIGTLNCEGLGGVPLPWPQTHYEYIRVVGSLTEPELFASANALFKSHLELAAAGPISNLVLRSYVMAVNVILMDYEKGADLYQDTRHLLRFYLTLAHFGYLGRH